MEVRERAFPANAGSDPRRPFVLIGLGYIALCVGAVWLDYKVQLWRAKRRKKKAETLTPEEAAWFKEEKGDDDA